MFIGAELNTPEVIIIMVLGLLGCGCMPIAMQLSGAVLTGLRPEGAIENFSAAALAGLEPPKRSKGLMPEREENKRLKRELTSDAGLLVAEEQIERYRDNELGV
jgi:hypothetical protein